MSDDQQLSQPEPWENELGHYPLHQPESLELREAGEKPSGERFDLQERTARFGEALIRFAKKMPQTAVNDRIIHLLVGCGTSLGANYYEADDAFSKKDFLCKIGICRKEAKETKFFLRMVAAAEPRLADEARNLWREVRELHLIFCSILRKGQSSK